MAIKKMNNMDITSKRPASKGKATGPVAKVGNDSGRPVDVAIRGKSENRKSGAANISSGASDPKRLI